MILFKFNQNKKKLLIENIHYDDIHNYGTSQAFLTSYGMKWAKVIKKDLNAVPTLKEILTGLM